MTIRPTPRELVERARKGDPQHVFFRVMDAEDKKSFDDWLMEIDHPSVYKAGTPETRFLNYVQRG